jgi:thiamine-monophosphate kinase
MRESELLAHIYEHSAALAGAFPQVVVGPGHDCAVIATPGGECLLLKVDQVVSGRHFRPFPETSIDLIARKAVARAISDIAAAGGTPTACMVGAVLPDTFEQATELFDSLRAWAASWGCPLVGGDTATLGRQGSQLVLSVSVVGNPDPRRGPVLRSGAAPGDAIYMTGEAGGSLDRATGGGHHLLFEPRLAESRWLCDTLGDDLHAMMDISDGVGRDAGRMAAASGVRFRLESAALPLRAGITDWRRGAGDGEDYELLFTLPANRALSASVPKPVTRLTRIGSVERGSGCVIVADGQELDASNLGFEHGV